MGEAIINVSATLHNTCRGGIFSSCQKDEQPEIVENIYTTSINDLEKNIQKLKKEVSDNRKLAEIQLVDFSDGLFLLEASCHLLKQIL